MGFNGSGTYSLPSGNPVVNNTIASSTTYNTTLADIATALSLCIAKDGQSTPTANIPMGGYQITNLGDGSALTSAATVKQLQNNGAITLTSVSGTDTITATATPVPSAYASGQIFVFEPAANNTGAATINISSLGAKDIYLNNAAIGADVLVSGQPVVIRYNGTQFEIIGKADFASLNATSNTFAGNLLVNGNTTLGNGSGDSVTFNASTASIPNGLNVGSNQFNLDTSGNILLGLANNSGFGTASRQLLLNGSSTARFEFGIAGSQHGGLFADSDGVILYTSNSGDRLRFDVAGTERARLDSNGFAKFANTGTFQLSGSQRHEFNSDQALPAVSVINTSTSSSASSIDANLNSGAVGNLYNGSLNGVQQFRVRYDGNVENTNNSYGALSDANYKNLIEQVVNDRYTERFKKVKFWVYSLVNDPDNKKLLGVVAQELKDIFPGLITETEEFKEVVKTKTITKKIQKTKKVIKTIDEIKIINGKHTLIKKQEETDEPVFTEHELFDETGKLIKNKKGTVKVKEPVLIEKEEKVKYKVKVPTGKKTLSVNYSILYLITSIIAQNLINRVEKLENNSKQV